MLLLIVLLKRAARTPPGHNTLQRRLVRQRRKEQTEETNKTTVGEKTQWDHNTLKLSMVRQGRNWKSIVMRFVLSVRMPFCLFVCLSVNLVLDIGCLMGAVSGIWYLVFCISCRVLDLWFWDLVFRVCVFVCFCFVAETFRAGFEWLKFRRDSWPAEFNYYF